MSKTSSDQPGWLSAFITPENINQPWTDAEVRDVAKAAVRHVTMHMSGGCQVPVIRVCELIIAAAQAEIALSVAASAHLESPGEETEPDTELVREYPGICPFCGSELRIMAQVPFEIWHKEGVPCEGLKYNHTREAMRIAALAYFHLVPDAKKEKPGFRLVPKRLGA